MENIKIGKNTHNSHLFAFVIFGELDTIHLHLTQKNMINREDVLVYAHGVPVTIPLTNLVLAFLEHESIHIILEKYTTIDISVSLDNIPLEFDRIFEHWKEVSI